MYAVSPKMNTLQVPSTRYPIKIQPMDAGTIFVVSDDDDEGGLGYQNTLVRINISTQREIDQRLHCFR